jgi:phosphopantothenoylcysteine decarboxylase/phosphopantothenate--cysteine ligase
MAHLTHRKFIIGVSGGIAAYKSAELVRLLRKAGAEVRVVMTRGACEFITPLTLQALSGNPVHTELLDEEAEAGMGHIELARWADAVLIAPATADLIARLADGRADDLLTSVVLASAAPLLVAPAMNQQMWRNAATADNIERLRDRGILIVGPAAGEQACGDVGEGRLLEPAEIVDAASSLFSRRALEGRRVVITAGPTREAIDPVRFLSNHSSGKMGFAIARAAADAGAHVTLVTGPVHLETPEFVQRIDVESAQQMLDACLEHAPTADLFIAAAAVADYRPAQTASQKIKKQASGESLSLPLVRNPDVLAQIAAHPHRPAVVVGFAAETENLIEYAREKLERKGLDLIVANDVSREDIGFNSEQNQVLVITATQNEPLPMGSKQNIARWLIDRFADQINSIDHDKSINRESVGESA